MSEQLNHLREKLDTIDTAIISLLNQRMDVAKQIGCTKEAEGLPMTCVERENTIINKLRSQANNMVLKEQLEDIFFPIFKCSKQLRAFECSQATVFKNIGIIGVGLIGSSIARAVKSNNSEINIIGVNPKLAASEAKYLDSIVDNIEELVSDVEVVIIATPIDSVISIAEKVVTEARRQKKNLLVLDVASVKGKIAKKFEEISCENITCIATHPMTGSEHKGNAFGKATLFFDAPWLMIKSHHIPEKTIKQIREFIHSIGAKPIVVDAEEHDRMVALISHVPGILAIQYHRMVEELSPNAQSIKGPGYRSFTRIAHSNSEMRQQIEIANKDQILQWLEIYIKRIAQHEK